MSVSSIEWTDRTWNPVRGCSRVSEGCRNCYAERMAARFSRSIDEIPGPRVGQTHDAFHGFATMTPAGPRWTGKVELITKKLQDPLRWRKPQKVFVNSMSDLGHELVTDIDRSAIFGVMANAYWHTFQVLTKRPQELLRWFQTEAAANCEENSRSVAQALGRSLSWPLPNVWIGVSIEDQGTADERIPLLLKIPAARRFVSYEPALGPVNFAHARAIRSVCQTCADGRSESCFPPYGDRGPHVDWIIVGGESGPGARPFNVDWASSTIEQCRRSRGPRVFVKQLGRRPTTRGLLAQKWPREMPYACSADGVYSLQFEDPKGGDLTEWREDLQVREFPESGR